MADDALRWVFDHSKSKPPARLVLVCMGLHADQNDEVWLPISALARAANTSETATRRYIDTLVNLGEIHEMSEPRPHWQFVARICRE